MDGANGSDLEVQEYGTCQPNADYCTQGGEYSYVSRSNIMECDYQGVKNEHGV